MLIFLCSITALYALVFNLQAVLAFSRRAIGGALPSLRAPRSVHQKIVRNRRRLARRCVP